MSNTATVDETFPRLAVERRPIVGFDDFRIPIRTEDFVHNWSYCLSGGTAENFCHGETRVLIDHRSSQVSIGLTGVGHRNQY